MARGRQSDFEFRQQATLSQKLAAKDPDFQMMAGSDETPSLAIARLKVLGQHGLLDLEQPWMKLVLDLLNAERKVKFATSERTNEITKMGLMMPKGDNIIEIEQNDIDD